MKRTWTDEDLASVVPLATSYSNVLRRLGLHSNSSAFVRLHIERLGLDVSHFTAVRRTSDDELGLAVAASGSVSGVLRHLGLAQAGGTHAHYGRRIRRLGLDTSHFQAPVPPNNAKAPAVLLDLRPDGSGRAPAYQLRRALLESGVPEVCVSCDLGPVWNGEPLRLQVDHVDGNWLNNRRENLRFLCPNCHTQTPTHGRRLARESICR